MNSARAVRISGNGGHEGRHFAEKRVTGRGADAPGPGPQDPGLPLPRGGGPAPAPDGGGPADAALAGDQGSPSRRALALAVIFQVGTVTAASRLWPYRSGCARILRRVLGCFYCRSGCAGPNTAQAAACPGVEWPEGGKWCYISPECPEAKSPERPHPFSMEI